MFLILKVRNRLLEYSKTMEFVVVLNLKEVTILKH